LVPDLESSLESDVEHRPKLRLGSQEVSANPGRICTSVEQAVVKQICMATTPKSASLTCPNLTGSPSELRSKSRLLLNINQSVPTANHQLHSIETSKPLNRKLNPLKPLRLQEAARMSAINLAPREHQMLLAIGKYINTSAVDWEALAGDLEYKSAKAARDKWYPLRDKLFGKQAAASTNGTATPGSKKKATPRKRKNSDDDGEGDATPSKKKIPKKASKNNQSGSDEDDEEKAKDSVVKSEPGREEGDDDGLDLI
ncbi:hypothetical protein HII31_12189, partial [Pseudocercospora fuligena]